MRHARVIIMALVACATVGSPLSAQIAEVSPGARIRFRAPPIVLTRTTVTVLERHDDSVRVGPEKGSPFTVPLSAFTTLDLSRGKSRAEGAKVGALWGAGLYAILGLALTDRIESCTQGTSCTKTRKLNAGDVLSYTAAGAVTGGIIGALIGREKWERVPLLGR